MKHPKTLSIKDFSYQLNADRIAMHPLNKRDASKLLVYKSDQIEEYTFNDLPNLLPEKSILFFNNTKVVHARLLFQKESGATIEIFCLNAVSEGEGEAVWHCMVGNAKRWKGEILKLALGEYIIYAEKQELVHDYFKIKFTWQPQEDSFYQVIEHLGKLPLPPYINRVATDEDEHRYQTVYAKHDGSVAAPTAGLHFTDDIFNQLELRGIKCETLTLHVGAGTFKPVKAETMQAHEMHREQITITKQNLLYILNYIENYIIPVGTTSMRTLESIYWLGVKLYMKQAMPNNIWVRQWDPYDIDTNLSANEAIKSVLAEMDRLETEVMIGYTEIMIAPSYEFRICKGLITNFHQPESTLLLLVAAFVRGDWRQIYNYALSHEFRFLSYGDSSLLLR
jgi:S-adenosylmethionine:tRNA ribosyltransferase-isomerase